MDDSASTRRRWRALQVAGALLVVLLAALLIAERHLKSTIEHVASARTGREVRIAGEVQVHLLSRHPALSMHEVSVGNPRWVPPGNMAQFAEINVLLEWRWALPPLAIRRLELNGAQLHLVRDEQGRANWYLREEGPGRGAPLMHSLSMPDAHVELHDARRHVEFAGVVSAGDGTAQGNPGPLRIEGAGQLNGRAASFWIMADPLATVRRDQPYHFKLEERSGAARLRGQGFLQQPFDFRQLQGSFVLKGPTLSDTYYLVGLKMPRSVPFELAGKMARDGTRFRYTELRASAGDSDMAGSVTVDSPGGRTHLEAQLSSRRLRLADLGEGAGAASPDAGNPEADTAPGGAPPPPAAHLLQLPDKPLRVTGLQKIDAAVKFHAALLEVGRVELTDASGRLTTEKGLLSVSAVHATVAGGTLSGEAQLDARHPVPRGAVDAGLTGAQLDQLRGGRAGMSGLTGALDARVQLSGTGNSWRAMAGSADGTLTAVVPRGAMRAALAEAASLELAGALGLMTKSQKETTVRCAVANFDAHDGVLTARTVVVDTDKALITATGSAQLDSEALDFTLRGRPKGPAIALRSAVAVRGTLAHPQFKLAGGGAAAQGGVAAALGVALTPLAAALAFVNPGLAHDADCSGMVASLQAGASDVNATATDAAHK